ncbi:glucan phosphoethanolaminetransferase (alkaline phosphatase superfamily) [Staphylococcus saprophyticus]
MNTNSDTNSKKTIINSISLATCMSFVYIIIFIALMLVSNKIIQVDTVALPAIFIFLVISGIEFVFAKLKRNVPQVFNIIFFIIVIIIAIAMTIIL